MIKHTIINVRIAKRKRILPELNFVAKMMLRRMKSEYPKIRNFESFNRRNLFNQYREKCNFGGNADSETESSCRELEQLANRK